MSQLEFTQATAPALSAFIEAAEIINDMRGTKTLYNRVYELSFSLSGSTEKWLWPTSAVNSIIS